MFPTHPFLHGFLSRLLSISLLESQGRRVTEGMSRGNTDLILNFGYKMRIPKFVTEIRV